MQGGCVVLMDGAGIELGRLHVPSSSSREASLAAEVRRLQGRVNLLELEIKEERSVHTRTARELRDANDRIDDLRRSLKQQAAKRSPDRAEARAVEAAHRVRTETNPKGAGRLKTPAEEILRRVARYFDLRVGVEREALQSQWVRAARRADGWAEFEPYLNELQATEAIRFSVRMERVGRSMKRWVSITLLREPRASSGVAEQAPKPQRPLLATDWQARHEAVFGLVTEDCGDAAAALFQSIVRESLVSESGDVDGTSIVVLRQLGYAAPALAGVEALLRALREAGHVQWEERKRDGALPLWRIEPRGVRR